MNRRVFIHQSALSLLAAPFLASCKETIIDVQGKKSVIIIGAGIAGLAAAKKLKQSGFVVTVIESQEKIGGRIRTNRTAGLPFDEGASWIHGIKGNPLVDLANQAGASSVQTDDTLLAYDIGGVKYTDAAYTKAEDAFYNILDTLMKKGSNTQSFQQVYQANYPQLQNDRLYQFLASTYLTFDTGDLDKLSSLYYDEGEIYDDNEKIMTNGYDFIPNYLGKDLDIKLNERVSKINYTNNKTLVTSNLSSYEADYVLVTVPLGVLKKGIIGFSPALPTQKQTAIEKVGMSAVNKFLLSWDKVFWDKKLYLAYTPKVPDKFNYFVNFNYLNPNINALLTFAYAQEARDSEQKTDNQIIDEIMLHLKDMYGNKIPNPKTFQRTRWYSNPNSYGAYSYTQLGMTMNQFDDLAAQVNNKLFFAGEHTHKEYFSTAHGAYLSGLREADKIIGLQ